MVEFEYLTSLEEFSPTECLEQVENASNGHHLWYDNTAYRYGLYINDEN